MEFFFEHTQIRRLIAETLNEDQIRRRGYFEPAYVKNLLGLMETREFVYLKQVMALVILELWHRIFIDRENVS
jgi:asparagine synthase (glutamine-hydrolysing)